jgi:hypothetical protein
VSPLDLHYIISLLLSDAIYNNYVLLNELIFTFLVLLIFKKIVKDRDHLGDVGTDGRIILKMIVEK